jgi:lipopolysaccharide/colanic/teichoic acid biosynthesis glycosyltransferase
LCPKDVEIMAADAAEKLEKVSTSGGYSAKAAMDLFGSLALILLLSPVLILISLFVLLTMGRPIFFRQLRTGLHGKSFHILKFRTMAEPAGQAARHQRIADEERVTPFGRLLRLSSLDELPQLFNVLMGQMSLVGPRPQVLEFNRHYNTFQRRRHEVKPGITGWAQINGRNAIDWERKFELDVWYVDNHTLFLDIKILFLTPFRLFAIHQNEGPYRCSSRTFVGTRPEAEKASAASGPTSRDEVPAQDRAAARWGMCGGKPHSAG